MGKKERKKNISVFTVIEGKREKIFFSHLINIYEPHKNNIKLKDRTETGGSLTSLIGEGIKKQDRDRVLIWLDEDFEYQKSNIKKDFSLWNKGQSVFLETKLSQWQSTINIESKKPTLVISSPICADGFILNLLGKKVNYEYNSNIRDKQINDLKNSLIGMISNTDEKEFYSKNLNYRYFRRKKETLSYIGFINKDYYKMKKISLLLIIILIIFSFSNLN